MLPRLTLEQRFWAKVIKAGDADCWHWAAARDRHGYGVIGQGSKTVFAHRLSWQLHNGAEPRGLCVLHKCDTPSCVNPNHLFVGTQADNVRDMTDKKRGKMPVDVRRPGELNGAAKLCRKEVEEIRSAAGVVPQRILAKQYGISPAQVCRIQTGQRWQNATA